MATYLQGGFFNATLRSWQSRTPQITAESLIYPIFVSQEPCCLEEIKSLPGQYRVGKEKLEECLSPFIKNGLKTVLLFGIMGEAFKSNHGEEVTKEGVNPVLDAIKVLRQHFPTLTIACDVCVCGYMKHGHCGVLDHSGHLDSKKTTALIKEAAYAYAKAGCHIIAPSGMCDGQVKAISNMLDSHNWRNRICIMSYSAKYASCFYGPFRDAVGSAPAFGDRNNYQLPPGGSGLGSRSVARDIDEGADIVMVKPGMPYLDMLKSIKTKHPEFPLAVYQVSGEYAMLHYASEHEAINRKEAIMESLTCFQRAGADIVISYFTPEVLQWLKEQNEA